MTRVIRTGVITPTTGLVDYLADGKIVDLWIYPEDSIPCTIGYLEDVTPDGEDILRAAFLFIKDGITDKGNHYNRETINLEYNNYYIVNDEEV